ncbi:MAG: hypothetical protein OXC60_14025 [Litoreibacter sp.]|nr:hypothetical protein [Litoreibacter sp.]
MNALPLKRGPSPSEAIDALVKSHGLLPVVLAIGGRILKRSRPPDSTAGPHIGGQLHIDNVPENLRKDVGLDPVLRRDPYYHLAHVTYRDLIHF